MARWLFLSMAIGAFIASAGAVPPAHLSKRESGVICPTLYDCTSYYSTGSARCAAGYKSGTIEAKGYPVGTYCERRCTDDEKKQCNSRVCGMYNDQCRTYPASPICSEVLNLCGGPVKTTKDFCTKEKVGRPVVYNDETGKCDIVHSDDIVQSEKYLHFDFGSEPSSERLIMTCAPLTAKGAQILEFAVLFGVDTTHCLKKPSSSADERVWRCNDPLFPKRRAEFEKVGERGCERSPHPGTEKPVFKKYIV